MSRFSRDLAKAKKAAQELTNALAGRVSAIEQRFDLRYRIAGLRDWWRRARRLSESSQMDMKAVLPSAALGAQPAGGPQAGEAIFLDAHPFQPDVIEVDTAIVPKAARAALYAIVALIAFGLVWAALAEIDKVIHATGRLITVEPTLQVQPMRTALVREVKVGPGDAVAKGQILALLDPTLTEADAISTRDQAENLEAELARLQAEFRGESALPESIEGIPAPIWAVQKRHFAERAENYRSELQSRINEMRANAEAIESTRVSIRNLEAARKVTSELETMQRDVYDSGHGNKAQLLAAEEKDIDVRTRLDELRKRRDELGARHQSLQDKVDAFKAQWRQQISRDLLDATKRRQEFEQARVKAGMINDYATLRAPDDAIVLNVAKYAPGSIIRENEPLLQLVPLSSKLEAEVTIQTKDISWVAIGNKAQIKLEALPFQKYGSLRGALRTVSPDIVMQPAAQMPAGQINGAIGGAQQARGDSPHNVPAYSGRVTILANELRNLPQSFRLLPGMALSADITVGDRTVLSYLLDPIVRALKEAIREP